MIAIADCNNFYASCERLFQPKLEGKPVIVLSNNDGCAVAMSDEAKAIGIKMGSPAHLIKDIIEKYNVAVFSSNYTLYGDLSRRVMETLNSFVPEMEIYSIDEAFLDFSNFKHQNLYDYCVTIKKTVKQNIGIPVSIGIAPTKALAKMANRFAKKTKKQIGVHYMKSPDEINEVLQFTEVGDIWGVGSQYKKLLIKNGFKTAFDFTNAPEDWVRTNMSVVGLRLQKELNGISAIEWEDAPPPKKNICTARGFGKLLTNVEDIKEALSTYAANCALKLREQKSQTNMLQIFVQTNIFRTKDKQYFQSITVQLPQPTNLSSEIIKYALIGLKQIFKQGYNYHKVGIMVLDITPESASQTNLFSSPNEDATKATEVMDKLNIRFGRDKVRMAALGFKKSFKLKQERLSPCYTTNINQLLTIRLV